MGRQSTAMQEQRRAFVAKCIRKGVPYVDVYRQTIKKFGVARNTVVLDFGYLAALHREWCGDEDMLATEVQAGIDRIRKRAVANGPQAQRADEYLIRLAGETAAVARLKQLGYREDKQKMRLKQLELLEGEARLRLANAKAELAETTSKRGGSGVLVIQFGDGGLSGGMSPEELAQLTPSKVIDVEELPDDGVINLGTGTA